MDVVTWCFVIIVWLAATALAAKTYHSIRALDEGYMRWMGSAMAFAAILSMLTWHHTAVRVFAAILQAEAMKNQDAMLVFLLSGAAGVLSGAAVMMTPFLMAWVGWSLLHREQARRATAKLLTRFTLNHK